MWQKLLWKTGTKLNKGKLYWTESIFINLRISFTYICHMIVIMLKKSFFTTHLLLTNPTTVFLNNCWSFRRTAISLGIFTWHYLSIFTFMRLFPRVNSVMFFEVCCGAKTLTTLFTLIRLFLSVHSDMIL